MTRVDGVRFMSLLLCVSGCGGSKPPPPSAGPEPTQAPSASESPPSSTAELPATPELMAGIKAFDAGNYAEARKAFDSATKKNPNNYEALYNLGMTCERLGDRPAAETAYKAALGVKPDLDNAAAELASLYADDGRVDDALAVARAGLGKHPDSGPLHESLGIALAAHGDQDAAVKEFEAAIKLAPSDPMLHLTFAHWLNMWHVRGASPHLDVALGVAKDDLGLIASIGHEYRMAGEFDSCIKAFNRAVMLKDGGEVRTERALCKLGQKDDRGTMEDLQAAVAKEPNYAPAHYYLGGRLAMTKRFQEATAEYSKYLELDPNGSLAKAATERLKAAQEAATRPKPPAKKK